MAIRTFNSVGGFSVGEIPTNVIYPNGDVSSGNVTVLANVTVGNITTGTGNITVGHTLLAGNVRTDHLLYANGVAWDLQEAAGSNNYIQYNSGNNFAASSDLTYDDAIKKFKTANIEATGNLLAGNILANNLSNTQVLFSGANGLLVGNANFTYSTSTETLTVTNFSTTADATINGNLTVNGTVTSLATNNTTIDDNTVTLNKGETGNGVTLGTSGLEIDRGTAGANATLLWTESANAWVFKLGANKADISLGNLFVSANANIGGNVNVTGNLTADTFVGNLSGNVQGGNINGNLQAPGNTTEMLFNDANVVKSTPGITYNKTSNLVTLSGNLSVANITNGSSITFSNGGYIDGTVTNSLVVKANSSVQLKYDGGSNSTIATANVNGFDIEVFGKHWAFDTTGDLKAPGNIYANTGEFSGNTLYINSTGNIRGDVELGGNLNVASTTNILGDLTVGNATPKNANITGNLLVGVDANITANLTTNTLAVTSYVKSNLIPSIDADGSAGLPGYDLGTPTHRWRDLWLSGFSIQLGNTSLTSGPGNTFVTANANIFTGLLTGNVDTTGYVNIGNATNRQNLTVSGNANITTSTAATSKTTGALIVAGGVGISGNIYVGGATANIDGNLLVGNSSANANANITGDLKVGGNASVTGDVTVSGNLLVTGGTTYIDVTTSSIKDPLIDLGGNGRGANATSPDNYDRGLILRTYSSGPVNQFMGWKSSAQEFQLLSGVTDSNNVVTGSYANLRIDTLYGNHIYGVIETVNQPNIGNLLGLFNSNISNTLNVNNAVVSTLTASSLKYPKTDGNIPSSEELTIMISDGKANLGFTTIKTNSLFNGSSNVVVDHNGNINLTSNAHTTLVVTETGANISGNLSVTGSLVAGNIKLNDISSNTVTIGNSTIGSYTVTTTAVTPGQILAQVSDSTARAVEFFVKGEQASGGKYSVATVVAVHNGTDIAYDVYGTLNIGGYTGSLGVNRTGGNIQLTVTPASSDSTVWTTQYKTI
jgi:carbonic anhydrase/acetyltransferase-like protein (isoleucine patch superfamily)